MYDVSDRPWYLFKKHLFISLLDDPFGTFLQVLKNVIHVEDIKSCIHCKIESIGDEDIQKDLESSMKRKQFNEVKGIAMEMKASGQTKVLVATC